MRIRSIKPEFWRSDDVAALSLADRLLFVGLWSYVDDSGIGADKLAAICADLFALDLAFSGSPPEVYGRVHRGLLALSDRNLITRYEVDGRRYLAITSWSKHQRIDKPTKGRYPSPDDPRAVLTCEDHAESVSFQESSGSAPGVLHARSRGAGEQGSRGTGEKVKPSPATGTRVDTAMTPVAAASFDAFWHRYPRRIGKQAARVAWQRAWARLHSEGRAPDAVLLDAAERFRDDPTRDPAFTPHPATWLNQGRWDDEGPARPVELNSAEKRQAANLALIERFAEPQQPTLEPSTPEWLATSWGSA